MCGLTGYVAVRRVKADLSAAVRKMTDYLHSRGPDATGFWTDEGVILGHRRLAILDLDPRANQPMHSTCGRYVIVFNGEIYNFRELRRELEQQGVAFRTTSDTEVILALFAAEGEGMLARLRGMFAFVIWDRVGQRAFAARDPYGIKPLYYAEIADGILFASQVKALLATGLVPRECDARGQAGFWLLGSVPEPYTWYRAIRALPAGHCVWIHDGRMAEPRCWWDIAACWREAPVCDRPVDEIRARVRDALRRSVAAHQVSDVPVGVFLSGGVDSGALAGLMVEAGARDLQGVTVAFREFAGHHQDEAPVAARIAAHYGIRHHIRRVTREEFESDLPRILQAMDQPSIDGVNTWYASKAVAELGLKVVVSGIGGDELFLGYDSFRQLPRLVAWWSRLAGVPGALPIARLVCAWQARRSGKRRWAWLPEWARTLPGAWWLRRSLHSPDELPLLMGLELATEGLHDFNAADWVKQMTGALPKAPLLALGQIESTTYLRNQLLRDSDWASMDHSVELRTPLVDAWLLRDLMPLMGSFNRFPNKRLLADSPNKPLPRAVIERRKTGFGVPVQAWLRTTENDSARDPMRESWEKMVSRLIYERV